MSVSEEILPFKERMALFKAKEKDQDSKPLTPDLKRSYNSPKRAEKDTNSKQTNTIIQSEVVINSSFSDNQITNDLITPPKPSTKTVSSKVANLQAKMNLNEVK